jgi:large subunit ribosomal protein L23
MEPESAVVRLLITEKSTRLAQDNQYAFVVNRDANKIQIREAIQKIFKVTVLKVRTMNLQGKLKHRRLRWIRRSATKRAIVTLAKGQQIDAGTLK